MHLGIDFVKNTLIYCCYEYFYFIIILYIKNIYITLHLLLFASWIKIILTNKSPEKCSGG